MINTIKGLQVVDFIGERKGTFQAIVKVQAGFMSTCQIGSELPSLTKWKKGALLTIEFQPEGTNYWLTVFAKKGTKSIIIDQALAQQLEVGVVNQLFFNTNLMDQNQYKAVNAKTWADKVFVLNE